MFRSPNKNNRRFWDFTRPADLVLSVDGCEFYVHRSMLSNASPVFQVMLESDHFVEKTSYKITLPDKSANDIQQMLNFIYPFGHQIAENTDVESLLNLSREYQIKKIKDLCEAYLLRKVPTIEEFIIAQEYDMTLLREKCLKQLSEKPLNGIQDHPRFQEISDRNRILLMGQQLKKLQTYCRKISQIAHAPDMRYMPITTHIHCGHKPRNCNNAHFICQLCRASTLRNFIKDESWKLGQEKTKN